MSAISGSQSRQVFFENSSAASLTEKRSAASMCGCCGIVGKGVLKGATEYYKAIGEQSAIEHFGNQVRELKERTRRAHEHFLRHAIDLCREANHMEEIDGLIQSLREHFERRIERLREKEKHAAADSLQAELEELNRKFLSGDRLLDLKSLLDHLKSKLHKKSHASDENQVYRVKHHRLTGRESLPGTFKRGTSSTSFDDDKEVNHVFELNGRIMEYAKVVEGFDFVQFNHPSIFSVGSNMANAYYTPEKDQTVVGNGAGLMTNLAFHDDVLAHETEHRKMEKYVGEARGKGVTGLGYVCTGKDESGALNEAGADIAAMVQSNEELSKSRGVLVLPSDDMAADCYKIGLGIWNMGESHDALRDPRTGIGWTSQTVIDVVGRPTEKFYMTYASFHEEDGTVVNRYVGGIGGKDPLTVEVHEASEFFLKIFMNLIDRVGHIVPASKVHAIWRETYRRLPPNPSSLLFGGLAVGVAAEWRNREEYSQGSIDLAQDVRHSLALQGLPLP